MTLEKFIRGCNIIISIISLSVGIAKVVNEIKELKEAS